MAKSRSKQQVRIIAGEWRGRKLSFPDSDGLRPTSDRVRETLFNWLQSEIFGARCLDVFAGSGALGFEAASRGAKQVLMVEKHVKVHQALQASMQTLQADNVTLIQQDALKWLQHREDPFDVVFLDPPFQLVAHDKLCALLDQYGWVRAGGLVYLEYPAQQQVTLPEHWQIHKHKQAGNVHYVLAKTGV